MLRFLNNNNSSYKEIDEIVNELAVKQLIKEEDWKKFIRAFVIRQDSKTRRWTGEFFGKMMRGSSLIYQYSHDEELYELLTNVVKELLKTQDEYGRISTYEVDNEFVSWDIWCRKYVIVGLLHYYDICKDEKLKKEILNVLDKHVSYLISKIGEDKLDICASSDYWEGVNSCSILEPIMNLYNVTKEQKYLDFAGYIVKRGGTLTQNIIEAAYENKLMPYQYNQNKAYETMSFFEGVFEYYKVTKEEKLLKAVTNFVDAVSLTDLTVIGSCGCTHELFDNSTTKQIIETGLIMQETCVTVTWIRLNTKLLMHLEDVKYFENIESSFYNGLMGAINSYNEKQWAFEYKDYVKASYFDSYSPLTNSARGLGYGGLCEFIDGGFYGCCEAIGAAGIALMPLTSVMKDEEGIYVFNNYYSGSIKDDNEELEVISNYKLTGEVKIIIKKQGHYALKLRVPSWANKPTLTLYGKAFEISIGYFTIEDDFDINDELILNFNNEVVAKQIEDSLCFTYGPIVLAFDSFKQKDIDIRSIKFDLNNINIEKLEPIENEEFLRFKLNDYIYTNYNSCGKHFHDEHNLITVWAKVN